MNFKLHELIALFYELNGLKKPDGEIVNEGLLKQKMPLKVKIYLQRLNNIILEDVNLYEEAKKDLFAKYGKKEDGNIVVSADNIDAFKKEHSELLEIDKTIDVDTLWGSNLTLDSFSDVETNEFYPLVFKLIDRK